MHRQGSCLLIGNPFPRGPQKLSWRRLTECRSGEAREPTTSSARCVVTVTWENLEMDSGLFGDGSISLDWTGIDALPGLQPRLLLVGKLMAKGYGVGAVVEVTADVTAWEIAGTYAFLGTATPQP